MLSLRTVVARVIVGAPSARRVSTSRRALGTGLPGTLFFEVARLIQALGSIGHSAVVGRVPMSGTAVAEQSIAGFLETVKQLFVGVPVLTPLIITAPGAQLLSFCARSCITIAPARWLALKLTSRVVDLGSALRRHTRPTATSDATAVVHATALPRLESSVGGARRICAIFFLARSGAGASDSAAANSFAHCLPAASFTELPQQTLVGVIDPAPLDSFEPGLERYLHLDCLLVRGLDHNTVDRATRVRRLGDFAQELLGESAVGGLQWFIAVLLELNFLQLHGKVSGPGGTQDSFKTEDQAVVGKISPARAAKPAGSANRRDQLGVDH